MKYTLAAEINPLINTMDDALAKANFAPDEGSRANLKVVKDALNASEEWRSLLVDCLQQVFLKSPQLGHLIPRDLLWFAGSECLHFLDDSEIDRFAAIDEVWQTTELSWSEACSKTQL